MSYIRVSTTYPDGTTFPDCDVYAHSFEDALYAFGVVWS